VAEAYLATMIAARKISARLTKSLLRQGHSKTQNTSSVVEVIAEVHR
jgi:hypothetical protein